MGRILFRITGGSKRGVRDAGKSEEEKKEATPFSALCSTSRLLLIQSDASSHCSKVYMDILNTSQVYCFLPIPALSLAPDQHHHSAALKQQCPKGSSVSNVASSLHPTITLKLE